MLLPLKCICEQKNVRRDGTSIVYIQYCQNASQKTQLNTGIEIPPVFWDDSKQTIAAGLPASCGDSENLNTELKRMFRVAEDILEFAIKRKMEQPGKFAKSTFTKDFRSNALADIAKQLDSKDVAINRDIYFQIDDYLKSKEKKVCPDVLRIYRNMKTHLQEFELHRGKPITFECLDFTFYEEFVDFLRYEYVLQGNNKPIAGLKTNTIGKTIKHLRGFLKNRALKKIIAPVDMEGWTILEEEVDAVYMNWLEIRKIMEVDLSLHPHLIPCQNEAVVGCYTGLRFSDFSKLDEINVSGDLLRKKQQKSNHWVVIPLRPAAKEFLERHFKAGSPIVTNDDFNRNIKTIAKMAGINEPVTHSYKKGNQTIVQTKPKYQWITSHTCRRSFCTNEFLAGTPVELIMKISGHKSVKDFYKYIRISPEEAAVKMKEIWEKRGEYQMENQSHKLAS